ncbi:hypothetical protein KSL85_07450 [Klebsiella aerogenes]|nr:hypothetical protein [Klebsiella aerogenes]QXC67263.1 hypothetical protein KSL85_07450 [Klebsiella aerogenes]
MTISYDGSRAAKLFLAIIIGACIQKFFPGEILFLIAALLPLGIEVKG